jgi:two-component system LytT family sensor kinase
VSQTHGMPLRRAQAWLLAAGFWTIFAVICAVQVWMSMLTHGHSLARIILYQAVVWNLWIVFGFAVARLARRLPLHPMRTRNALIHLLAGCVIGLLHAAWWVACMLVIRPYDRMNPTDFAVPFLSLAFSQLPLELLLYALVALAAHANAYYAKYREREVRTAQLEKSLAEARLHALELQIQPHFLFNTLNAVSALIRTGQPEQAVGMIAGLSDLLRYALDRAGNQRVTVDEEAEMLRRYLEIQRLRFADRLTFEIDVAGEARRAAVPVLLLQPLAENAIRHGIATSAGPGRVTVRAFRKDGALRIEMFNSGQLAVPVERGIGLSNTVARLEQLYGAQQRFELRGSPEGVTAEVTIPWSEVA